MILITGASGRIARRTAELVSARGRPLRLMTRSPQRAPRLAGVEVVRGDFADSATLDAPFAGISVALVVSASGRPGERALLHANAFQAAAKARVSHVVYLSLQGASPLSLYPYNRDHFSSEQYLAAAGVPYTILRSSFYLDMFPDKFDAQGVVRGPAKQGRGAFVSREDVAHAAAAVLLDPPGGTHDVTGPELLSVADVAGRLSSLTGRVLRYEDALPRMGERPPEEDSEWQRELEIGWFQAIAAGELAHLTDTVLRFTGRAPLSLENYFSAFPELLRRLRG